jgi:hypothetical protein
LERVPRDPVAEMGQGVREEHAPEEVRDMMVPTHGCSLLAAKPMLTGLSHGILLRFRFCAI